MTEIELPNGDVVEPGDVILFEGYPYRVDRNDAIVLSPVYWGESALDLSYKDAAELSAEWSDESEGLLTESEWQAWLADARRDDRFGDDELDAVADAVLESTGLVDRLRSVFGLD